MIKWDRPGSNKRPAGYEPTDLPPTEQPLDFAGAAGAPKTSVQTHRNARQSVMQVWVITSQT